MSYPLASLIAGVISLVLALFTCGFGGLSGLVAIGLAATGRRRIRNSAGSEAGDGLALAGLITGAVATAIGLLAVAFVVIAVISGNADLTPDPMTPSR